MISIAGFDAAGAPLGGVTGTVGTEAGDSASLLSPAAGATKLRLGIEPAPGWIFTHVARDGAEAPVADTLMGVFVETAPDTNIETKVAIDMVPLFRSADGVPVNYTVTAAHNAAGAATLSVTVASAKPIKRRVDCTTLLAHGLIGNGDPACTLRTMALAVLTGWSRGLLAAPIAVTTRPLSPRRSRRPSLADRLARLAGDLGHRHHPARRGRKSRNA